MYCNVFRCFYVLVLYRVCMAIVHINGLFGVSVWYMKYWPRTGHCRQAIRESSPSLPEPNSRLAIQASMFWFVG